MSLAGDCEDEDYFTLLLLICGSHTHMVHTHTKQHSGNLNHVKTAVMFSRTYMHRVLQ